ncbi:MAG: hypothetical protein JWN67_2636 [Actinomycetia bacterium]|nr:hypothetical protein [Actinomycetes bacterium]
MTATFVDGEVDRYVAEVAAHLGALPPADRSDLLDDLREHLAEVAAEADGSLVSRLGSPADYAAELLASAGLAPTHVRAGLVEQARAVWRSVEASTPYRSVADFVPELRPAWWVLRPIALVFTVHVFLVNDYQRTWPWPDGGPVNRGLVLIPLWLGVVASVAVGRWSAAGNRSRLVWLGNLLVVPAALFAITAMREAHPGYRSPSVYEVRSGFNAPDGTPVTNLFPYGADGQLLHGVLLYDQNGVPIDLRDQAAGQGIQTQVTPDANGAPIANAYPYEQHRPSYGDQGTSTGQAPAIVVPRQATTATTEASSPTTAAPPFSGAG